jgi:hypothetical protein
MSCTCHCSCYIDAIAEALLKTPGFMENALQDTFITGDPQITAFRIIYKSLNSLPKEELETIIFSELDKETETNEEKIEK